MSRSFRRGVYFLSDQGCAIVAGCRLDSSTAAVYKFDLHSIVTKPLRLDQMNHK